MDIQDDIKEGIALGIRNIPVLLINGIIMEKPLTLHRINKAIRNALNVRESQVIKYGKQAA